MMNITHKISTLRKARAEAIVKLSLPETATAVKEGRVPKGNVFEFARAAGLLAIKKTSDLIPDCHPLPVEYAAIRCRLEGLKIIITVDVHTIYKTGVEVEAMHGASVTALTIYDMLKPLDKEIEIDGIRLIDKKGGKSDYMQYAGSDFSCAVVVCSDSIVKGVKQDRAGRAIMDQLSQYDIYPSVYDIIPDDFNLIQQRVGYFADQGYKLVIFTGGTGLSKRDVTPEAVSPLLTRSIPGIMEAARVYGGMRTAYAMLSRGVAGFVKDSLVLTLPGSTNGAIETMEALFPQLLHVFPIAKGASHELVD
ncbi:molybdenum cofactor biosynthesis protein MoaC [Arachidicoccus rhizosphaerae]|uniref:Molybdopterin adenylyltransferase n=1 Tax=Arachidicoccus rhizosphaerae TaxID=551991 RepID=A0A1H3WAN5_9BACT|nr:bifunctional molybdenum cofactor biosynthesis protein MoaC/MoaB [Arachidicoccus rhizosphaerae]SDZ84145.1 molybdenum cofactor biosynthesis protein MoaC [Arachidicoccus rhizosphaerae]